MIQRHAFWVLLVGIAMLSPTTAWAATCESLASLKLSQTTISAARMVAPGEFLPPGDPPAGPTLAIYRNLPGFCRVQGVIQPSSDSHVEFEVWLPASGWNGKYLGIGNGGFAGSIIYIPRASAIAPSLATALAAGYATSSTDTGHKGAATDASWAIGHPEKVVDYGYRGIHETAVVAKAIIAAYYGGDPKKSYFNSCSNGGRQALMEAQRFPADYDGIIAGAPSNFSTHLNAAQVWNMQALGLDPASYIPASKLPAIEAAAVAACDGNDGVKDGIIERPTQCKFDPAVLLCQGTDSTTCLTPPQVTALKKICAGPRTSMGEQIFPGLFPGAETGPSGWTAWIVGSQSVLNSYDADFGAGALANMVYENPSWDFRSFNFDRDVPLLDEKLGPVRNAINPDLKNFKDRGGKLILYHGWNDPASAPQNTIRYFESVVSKLGQKSANEFLRLYMVPGMQHCGNGPGATNFGSVVGGQADPEHSIATALERWVENGVAPDKIITTKYKTGDDPKSGVLRTRPLCPYPQEAQYKGSGDTDEAANFVCKAP